MEILSLLLYFIYSILILGIIVFVSPLLSAILMILIPVIIVMAFPDGAVVFFSILQFSYYGIEIYNLHILLMIWSAFIGIITYAEVLTWYLLRGEEPASQAAQVPTSGAAAGTAKMEVHEKKEERSAAGGQPLTIFSKTKDFLEKLYKILKGEKIKLR